MTAQWALGSLVFPQGEYPADGANEWVQPQTWSEFIPIGASAPGTLLTYLGSPSIKQKLTCYVTSGTRDRLVTIYNARAAALWTTPFDGTGYNVIMTDLSIVKDRAVRGTNRWKCTFTIVKNS